ncbi:MAG: hypothetical protein AB7O79_10425, partial [Xanthobacteraceae bacterium]
TRCEIIALARSKGGSCRAYNDRGFPLICHPNLQQPNEYFLFTFSDDFDPPQAVRLKFNFVSQSLMEDLIKSIREQYGLSNAQQLNPSGGVIIQLEPGLQLEIYRPFAPNAPRGLTVLDMSDEGLLQRGYQERQNKIRQQNPPRRF